MKYTKAEMELVEFEAEDIIRTSNGGDDDFSSNNSGHLSDESGDELT